GLPAVAPLTVGGVTLYRSLFAGLALAPFLPRLRSALKEQPAALVRDLAVAMAVYVTLLGTYVASMRGTTAANAIILQYTAPLYAIALSPLVLREPWRRADLLTLAIAVPGIAILIAGSFAGAAKTALLLGATSGFCFGFFLLWLRRLRAVDPLAITSLNNLGTALFFAALLALEGNGDLELPVRALHAQRPAAVTLGLLVAMGCL